MQTLETNQMLYGGFFVRLAAYIVDNIIVGLVLLTLQIPMGIITLLFGKSFLTSPILFQFSAWDIFLYLLTVGYFVILTYISGSTVGKKLFHLTVITADGEKLTFFNVLYRETIGRYLSAAIIFAGYFVIGVDRTKRGFHDMLCDTLVIYKM
ncbi:RDD family protein [Anaeromicropila populeti]|uniref:Uncharacterized membrane protein YckC, RDD family n=1 Tax=Anaeromicropila populeti TaxID=37658 RepID=A0A1I6I6Q5_9FIRM|nr:RDD family protein [Anaeromicropila populeti]SFR62393.1 Uncharacterized membrane protein YckC, RDD family [Anaeromicropila populeti]